RYRCNKSCTFFMPLCSVWKLKYNMSAGEGQSEGLPSSSIKLHSSMSPRVLSGVKNKRAMSTRPSANRNQ
ncbi:hypothetical protein HGM15179_001102, partial [Zosterops borbonicus]